MSGQDNEDMGFQQNRNDDFLNCPPSSGMNTNPMPDKLSGIAITSLPSMFKQSNPTQDPFFASGWDPIGSLGQNHEDFGGSSSMVSQGQFYNPSMLESTTTTSHLVQYQSDSSFVDMVPKLQCFGNGPFSDMVTSYGFSQCAEIATMNCPPNYTPNKDKAHETSSVIGGGQSHQDGCQISDSPNGKRRKRAPDSSSPPSSDKNVEEELSDVQKEQDEKKPKMEENTSGNMRGKPIGKQAKENSNSGETPKENYIHVRARRGQATNSHSLAERVRREKISERMRLLQELVPGCNKITGKAVMLDEIINYVQSLQQQVEFLSMKLATVNPELNIDIERLLSKDILNPRGGNGGVFGVGPAIGISQHYQNQNGMFQGAITTATPHFASLPQAVLDTELQGLFHMGFDSNSAIGNVGSNGRLKPEL